MIIHQHVSKAKQDDALVRDHGQDHMPAVRTCPTPPPMPRKPGKGWWLLNVVLAGEVAVIATVLLGRLLAAWLTMR
jgi:hypothetical protein